MLACNEGGKEVERMTPRDLNNKTLRFFFCSGCTPEVQTADSSFGPIGPRQLHLGCSYSTHNIVDLSHE